MNEGVRRIRRVGVLFFGGAIAGVVGMTAGNISLSGWSLMLLVPFAFTAVLWGAVLWVGAWIAQGFTKES